MKPTIQGSVARVWEMPNSPAIQDGHRKAMGYPHAAIGTWLISGPFHNVWHWWQLGIVHLRDIPGAPPAHKKYPGAEFEFMILSLAEREGTLYPSEDERVDACVASIANGEGLGVFDFLTPADAVVQFDGISDAQAKEIGEKAVSLIASGQASPDSDFRHWWELTIRRTAEHLRLGVHE